MLIFDSLLSEKRILFSGGLEYSAEEIQHYVFACASLISPPFFGILPRMRPYATLSNLEFVEDMGSIAGVTNPVIQQKNQWYDICCEVDIGKIKVSKSKDFYIYEKEDYYSLDMEFIRSLIGKIQNNQINDAQIQQTFESYARLMLDLALRDENLRTKAA